MKHLLLIITVLFICAGLKAQSILNEKQIEKYIPDGWVLEDTLNGDLNKDNKSDVVLVLRDTDNSNFTTNKGLGQDTLDLNPRRLIILFKTASGYSKILSTDHFLPSVNNGENPCLADPLSEGGISITKGVLKIHHHYWLSCGSWYVTDYEYVFRYQNEKFELIGLDVASFHRASGESHITSYNFSTRKKQTITGLNEFEEEKSKPVEKWEKLSASKLYNLAFMTEETAVNEIANAY